MLRFGLDIKTNEGDYELFIIDYNIDTINSENEGLYMIELPTSSFNGEYDYWQNRMKAGISILN